MTVWYARVKVFDRLGTTIYQRKITLEGWRDNVVFAAAAIACYSSMTPEEIATVTEERFKQRSQDDDIDALGFIDAETYAPRLDEKSAMLVGEEYYSGVAITKAAALLRYADADAYNMKFVNDW